MTTCPHCARPGVLDVQSTVDSYGTRSRYTCPTMDPAHRSWWDPPGAATKPESPRKPSKKYHVPAPHGYCWRCKRTGSHTLRCLEIQARTRRYRRRVKA